jgi:hypothetical protein
LFFGIFLGRIRQRRKKWTPTKKTRREKDTKMRKNKTTKKLTKIFFKGQLLLWAGVLSFNFLACQRNPEEGYITATGTVEARTSRISPRGSVEC